MRVLLGLAALAATANAQTYVVPSGATTNSQAATYTPGNAAFAAIAVYQQSAGQYPVSISPSGQLNQGGGFLASSNWVITVSSGTNQIIWVFTTNTFTAQMEYRWYPNMPNPATYWTTSGLSPQSYLCDPCANGSQSVGPNTANINTQVQNSAVVCNTANGPVPTAPNGTAGFNCANLTRTYTMINLQQSTPNNAVVNSFSVQLFDRDTAPGPNVSSYSFTIYRLAPPIVGDPQISGMQGQDFQVHGMPDEIFNMITYPNLQVNARFIYLSEGACHDNFTACFAHPGTYISEEGIRLGKDKIHVEAGSFKKGLTVSVNGKKVTQKKTSVKLGSVEVVNHRRVIVNTPIMTLTISNSDKFLNQETALADTKLLALGAERRELLVGDAFHPEVPLHGLQGQTWRNVVYPSGLEYEGSISDYHVTSGNLFGTEFTFNQYKH